MVGEYSVELSPEALAGLDCLDERVAQRILDRIKWLSLHVDAVNHKALTGHLRGAFKLRVGDHRVIYELRHSSAVVTVRLIGHRSDIYQQK